MAWFCSISLGEGVVSPSVDKVCSCTALDARTGA